MLTIKQFDGYLEIHADKMEYIHYIEYKNERMLADKAMECAHNDGLVFDDNDPLNVRIDGELIFHNVYDNDVDWLYDDLTNYGYVIPDTGNGALSIGLTNAPAFVYHGKVYALLNYETRFMTDDIYDYGYARLDFVRNFDREDLQNVCDYYGYDIDEEAQYVETIEQPIPCDDLPYKED